LQGRTENAVKNRWNSSARKRWFLENGLPLDERERIGLVMVDGAWRVH
jgi:hypothetical protein